MEFQVHPASPRRAVRRFSVGPRGERLAIAVAAIACVFALSLWITVPTLVRRALSDREQSAKREELVGVRRTRRQLETRAAGVRDRALDAGDRLSRIAFLYGVSPARWPRTLNPETGLLIGDDPEILARGCERYLAGLERGRAVLEAAEAQDPDLGERTPSRLPLSSDLVEPSAFFGPRVSPWTRAEEFFPGIDLAAPLNSGVIAPAAGTVLFVGRAKTAPVTRLTRFGNLVVLAHGPAGVTLYGHLARIDVRQGERVARGKVLGTVGSSGWAVSPGLHYEYWRDMGGRLAPTDPLFAILDRRFADRDVSLERMRATSPPSPIEPPPTSSFAPRAGARSLRAPHVAFARRATARSLRLPHREPPPSLRRETIRDASDRNGASSER